MSVEDLEEVVEDTTVFARVSPEHKLKIVNAFQKRGELIGLKPRLQMPQFAHIEDYPDLICKQS